MDINEENVKLKAMIREFAEQNSITLSDEDLQLTEVDWNELIDKKALVQIEGQDFIPLAELDRLARLRGYKVSESLVIQAPEYANNRNATITWRIVWNDGQITACSADANYKTINPGFKNYPVCIAESRARSRAIRLALGIKTCSVEEVCLADDEDLSGPANPQQLTAIQTLMKRKNPDLAAVFGEITANKIKNEGKELTYNEALTIIGKLNNL